MPPPYTISKVVNPEQKNSHNSNGIKLVFAPTHDCTPMTDDMGWAIIDTNESITLSDMDINEHEVTFYFGDAPMVSNRDFNDFIQHMALMIYSNVYRNATFTMITPHIF